MASAADYANWIVNNADKKGTPEFNTVAQAYQEAKQLEAGSTVTSPEVTVSPNESLYNKAVDVGAQTLKGVPRAAGLTARSALQGGGSLIDLLASPVRGAMNLALPESAQIKPISIGETAANALNLPKPATMPERMVGSVSEAVSGATTPYGAIKLLKPIQEGVNVAQQTKLGTTLNEAGTAIRQGLGSNLPTQITSAVGAGAGVGTVKELGGNEWLQLLAGLGAGGLTPMAARYVAKPMMQSVENLGKDAMSYFKPAATTGIDQKIKYALEAGDIKLTDISEGTLNAVRADLQNASKSGQDLSTAAIKRLIDYRLTGATPKVGTLTLNPKDVTREKNLAKAGEGNLAEIENANNQTLINNLNGLGASNAQESQVVGQTLYNKFKAIHDTNQQKINDLYSKAKTTDGREAEFDAYKFTNTVGENLNKELKNKFLPAEIKSMINDFATGKVPLNIQSKVQFQSIVSNAMMGAADGNTRSALKVVRDALENVPLKAGQQFGEEANQAFKEATRYTYNYKKSLDQIPALKAVADGASPDNFFSKHILNVDAPTFKKTYAQLDPEAQKIVKDNIVGFIKNKATGGTVDETAKISGSQIEKAIAQLGTIKINTVFSPEEVLQLKAIRNVAKLEQFQPVGSAVNNSNTASALMNLGGTAIRPLMPLIRNYQAGQATNINRALVNPPIPQIPTRQLVSPYSTTWSLLGEQDQQQ
jgi:hypothetical protein